MAYSYDYSRNPICLCGYRTTKERSKSSQGKFYYTCYDDYCEFSIWEDEYLKNENLVNVKSGKEFYYTLNKQKYSGCLRKFYQRLLKEYPQKLRKITNLYNNKRLSDLEIYGKMRDILYNEPEGKYKPIDYEKNETRNDFRFQFIQKVLPKSFSPKNLLDYGCGDGSITQYIGKKYEIEKENKFGCDVRELKRDDIVFQKVDENSVKLPFEDNSINLIISLMCLHHVKKIEETLKEFYRIINKETGVIVLREHDKSDNDFSVFLDIVHSSYATVFSDPPENTDFTNTYYAKYRSRNTWINILEKNNFSLLSQTGTIGIFKSFYLSFLPKNDKHQYWGERTKIGLKRKENNNFNNRAPYKRSKRYRN